MKQILQALKTILLPLLVGLLAGLIIRNDTDIYSVLIRPPFALPGAYFPIVWTVLYLLMGVSLYLFKRSAKTEKERNDGTLLFYTQLFLNFLWPIVFFKFRLPLISFILLVVLFIFIVLTTASFYKTNKISGILLLPYLLYTLYAGYLNFAVWLLNL